MKLLVLDLDHTIADVDGPILKRTVDSIKRIQQKGVQVMLLSGKPLMYLFGFLRQVQLKDLIVSGENGQDIAFDGWFPPQKYYSFPITKEQEEDFAYLHKEMKKLKEQYYIQTNVQAVTIFFTDEASIKELTDFAHKMETKLQTINIAYYHDLIDFTPKGIHKGNAVKYVMDTFHLTPEDVVCVGDNRNDITMFEQAATSIRIGHRMDYQTTFVYDTIDECLANLE